MPVVTLVIYDIAKNKLRRKIDAICKDHGLVREQLSAFRGDIPMKRVERLSAKIQDALCDQAEAHVEIYPICSEDFSKIIEMGSPRERWQTQEND